MAKNVTSADIFGGMFQNVPQCGEREKERQSGQTMIRRDCLHEFSSFYGHPFRVVEDEKMTELAESIRERGIVEPLIVRPDKEHPGQYEIISGHRRNHAAGLAGLTEVPARIEELDDDAAAEIMVDSNNRREVLLPSEKAWAYRTKAEARRHQGKRTDLSGEDAAADQGGMKGIGVKNGDSVSTVKRYIRLTYLIPDFLKLVDEEKLSVGGGYLISFFDQPIQQYLNEYCQEHKMLPDKAQIAAMAEVNAVQELNEEAVIRIMSKRERAEKPEKRNFTISDSQIRRYFPEDATKDYIEQVIMDLLEKWSENREYTD